MHPSTLSSPAPARSVAADEHQPHHTRPPGGDPIEIRGLTRVFADGSGLHPTDVDVHAGEFLSILGPSGCGKSTLLRCVAGLETPDAGRIRFGERIVYDGAGDQLVPPRRRQLGMVFQDLALWPHLNASENVAFPLRVARTPRAEVTARVTEALALVGLGDFAEKMPHQLSGGQQQRVAIARAIVARPRVLLMDEPFSALDAALRLQLRDELRSLTLSLGVTTIYVTHDQSEAMAMSDRIAVLERGVVRQVSSPEELYLRPENRFVADFIGRCNWLPGDTDLGVRPEHVEVRVSDADDPAPAGTTRFRAVVTACAYVGGVYAVTCAVDGATEPWSFSLHTRLIPGQAIDLLVTEHALIRAPRTP